MIFKKPQFVFATAALLTNMSTVFAQGGQEISICIIDPARPSGFRMQEARLLDGRDTVVTVGNANQQIREAFEIFPVARHADWYITGKPLVIGTGLQQINLFTYGQARHRIGWF